jgi:tagatose 1,6-diphosphate aldolase
MPESLPPIGKIRGLSAVSRHGGIFSILAFDHRQSFVKMLRPDAPQQAGYEEIVAAKSAVVRRLAPHASAVLLDPVYSAAQLIANGALPGQAGLLVALEETGYTGEDTARLSRLLPGWDVARVKRMGADAVKLLLYYNPFAEQLAEQQETLARQVIRDCQECDLALFLEAVSYSIDPQMKKSSPEFAAGLSNLLTETASRLGRLGPEVLKLEFPVDARLDDNFSSWVQTCQAISQASPVPWTVLSAGVEFEMFGRQVEAACRGGASGFIAGRAVWQEGVSLPVPARDHWMADTGARRLDHLAEIAARHARPWQDFYPGMENAFREDWRYHYPTFIHG